MQADLSIPPPTDSELAAPAAGDGQPFDADVALGPELAPQVDPTVIRGLLATVGRGVGFAAGDPDVPDHWRFTDEELDELAGVPGRPGALTRFVNRQPRLRAAAMRGDEMLIVTVLAGYTGRNIYAGRAAARDREGAFDGDEQREAEPAARGAGPAAGGDGRAERWGAGDGLHDGAWLGPPDAGPMAG